MVHVTSEVGRLRRVLVHEPGPEVDLMVPAMMEELLFDDILFGDRARDEHRRLRRLLKLLGVEVVEANRLLEEVLSLPQARAFLSGVLAEEIGPELKEAFAESSPGELVSMLVSGRRHPEGAGRNALRDLYRIPPLANWCFQRDPQFVVGDSVIFASMATPARWREALLSRALFNFHPELCDLAARLDPLHADAERPLFLGLHRPRLEGGDLLVLSRDVLAVGLSERTNNVALNRLLRPLQQLKGGPRYLLVVHLPKGRAYMHLDTVFTPVDIDAALVYPPVFEGSDAVEVYEIDLQSDRRAPAFAGSLKQALQKRGFDLEPLPCGGADPVGQQREQWTDGANALALAPGVIALYDRNVRTAEALSAHGFRVVGAEDVLLGREEVDLEEHRRTCLLLASHEIARARGGPHCLTHPLLRDDL